MINRILDALTETQKSELVSAIITIDSILDNSSAGDYQDTKLYRGMYEVMEELGYWC